MENVHNIHVLFMAEPLKMNIILIVHTSLKNKVDVGFGLETYVTKICFIMYFLLRCFHAKFLHFTFSSCNFTRLGIIVRETALMHLASFVKGMSYYCQGEFS